ncbi:MAG: hypothetical protein Q4P20_11535 [Eubacteriales bacterium]|nr:hypothetical protein [Eubacteriales bacterium]
MNAAISHFTGLELLYLAAFDLQIDAEFEAARKERERKYRKAYYQKHKERERARSRAYYANNTEAILARQLERYHKKKNAPSAAATATECQNK